jgi:cyclophilin family peptidyl-prolyl cis-trans isomerase
MPSKRQSHAPRYARAKRPSAARWAFTVIAVLGLLALLYYQVRRDATKPPKEISSMPQMQWSNPPEMAIDPTVNYRATLQTEQGDIVLQLFAAEAPLTVNNFVFLSRHGYYDGVTFHRVIPDFMAQGGDPTGTGSGGPGYNFADEVGSGLEFDRPGLLAMANAGPGTNGSQFFITYTPTPHLNGNHTIFGEVTQGMDIALAIPPRDPQRSTEPGVVIVSVTISED